jgi:flagellar biosynthetic protein FliO
MKFSFPVWILGISGFSLIPRLLGAAPIQAGGETLPETSAMTTAEQFGVPSVDFTWLFLKTVLAMVVVIALAVIVLRFVLPRVSLGRAPKGGSGMQLLERFPLDSKRMLYILQVEGRRLLLGASEHQVNLITELEAHEGERKT